MRRYVSRFGTRPACVPRSPRGAARVEAVEPRILLTTFTVTTTDDASPGSLRQAILDANASSGADTIAFSIGTGPQTIRPAADLPSVDDTTTIDGRTQPGWQGTPVIRLHGSAAGSEAVGLHLRGERSQVLDLSVTGFRTGLRLRGDHQAVAGCYVGIDPAGAAGANGYGIELSANFATIGSAPDGNGGTVADGNVISGNSNVVGFGFGLWVLGHGNTIVGNRIGSNPAGTAAVPNGDGVVVWGDGNHIGTPEASARGQRNIISGNRSDNVRLSEADGTFIQGNSIGADVTGYGGLGGLGLRVLRSADVMIGGTEPGAGNLISGNRAERFRGVTDGAVMIDGEASARAVVQGNFIGVRADGLFGAGNAGHGVFVRGAPDVVIGGTSAAARNVIGDASLDLIRVEGATARHPVIQGNYVGVNAAGDASKVHGADIGIDILGAPDAVIGGGQPGARNVVSRCRIGISLTGFLDNDTNVSYGISGARVQGNYIGINADGTGLFNSATFTFGNRDGLWVGGVDMLVGGTGPGEGNVISNNYWDGVLMGSRGVTLVGNRIGTTPDGTAALPNLEDGVTYSGGGLLALSEIPLSVLGGTAPGAANVISGNRRDGVQIRREGLVVGNLIGLAADGVTPLGNGRDGVRVEPDAIVDGRPMIGGTGAGAGNVIAYNNGAGVQIGQTFYQGLTPPDAAVLGNRIFANVGLGIDAGDRGVTPNDMPDTAERPQNFPVLTSAIWGGLPGETGTVVRGALDSVPDSAFRIELLSSRAVDPTGYGEGPTFIGSVQVVTDAAGHAEIVAALPVTLTQDDFVTATASRLLLVQGQGMRAVRTSEFSAAVQAAASPLVPPRVQYVNVTGGLWSRSFGNGPAGAYQVPEGAAQLGVLPWVNGNQVVVRFNRDVAADQSDLRVRGVNRPTYGFSGFSYDPVKHTATWTLDRPAVADKLMLDLASGDGGITAGDDGRLALDGEWANGSDAYPSGDGAAGGDFRYRLNLLPGDATRNGAVDALDLAYVKQRLNLSARSPGTGAATYTLFADLNADGRINALDLSGIKQWLNSRAPAGEPAQLAVSAGAAPSTLPPAVSVTQDVLGNAPSAAGRGAARVG